MMRKKIIKESHGGGLMEQDFRLDTQDGLFDVAWSEIHENQLVAASGDGSIKLFDVMVKVWTSIPGEKEWRNGGIAEWGG